MIDPLSPIALAQLLPDKPRHHAAHPLLADDGVARVVQGDVVVVVDAVVRRRDGRLFGEERRGLGGWHFGLVGWPAGGFGCGFPWSAGGGR